MAYSIAHVTNPNFSTSYNATMPGDKEYEPGIGVGCASLAYRKADCEWMRSRTTYGFAAPLYGTLFQQGPCAVIDPLRYEMGIYYQENYEYILGPLKTPNLKPELANYSQDWGRVLNCSEESLVHFADILIKHKDEILTLQEGFFVWEPRSATLNAIQMIHNDPILSKECRI